MGIIPHLYILSIHCLQTVKFEEVYSLDDALLFGSRHITTEDDKIQPFTVDLPGKYNHPSSLFLESILSYGRRIELGSRTYLVLLVMSTVKYTSSLRFTSKITSICCIYVPLVYTLYCSKKFAIAQTCSFYICTGVAIIGIEIYLHA